MTSNLGAAELAPPARRTQRRLRARRRAQAPRRPSALAETMIAAARAHLPPELYNRIDEVLCFGPLARAEVAEVARRLLGGLESSPRGARRPPRRRARRASTRCSTRAASTPSSARAR